MKNLTLTFLIGIAYFNFAQSQSISETIKLEISEQHLTFNKLKGSLGAQSRLVSNSQNSPSVNWSNSFGGSGFDKITDTHVDDAGQTYVTGYFSGDLSIAGNEFSSVGYSDGFVAKFSSSGDYLWCVMLSASSKNLVEPLGIHVDNAGNTFTTGRFSGKVNFGGTKLTSTAEESLFFVKINNSGTLQLTKKYESARGLNIATDASNNIYVVASSEPTSQPQHESVLLKYDDTGSIQFNQTHDEGFSDLVVDASGIYLAGTWHDSDAILDNDVSLEYDSDNVQYYFAFIAKMDFSGDFLWASVAEHLSESTKGTSKSVSITSDEGGNLYLGGIFQNDIILGSTTIESNYGKGGFVAKVNSSGTILFGQDTEMIEGSGKISGDKNGNLFATDGDEVVKYNSSLVEQSRLDQMWEPLVSVNEAGTKALLSGTENQGIQAKQIKLTNNNEIYDISFVSTTASASVIAIEMDNDGNVYTAGYTMAKSSFKGVELEKGYFLSKLDASGNLIWIKNFKCTPLQISNGDVGNKLTLSKDKSSLYVVYGYSDQFVTPDNVTHKASIESTIILKFGLDGTFVKAINENLKVYGAQIKTDYAGNLLFSGEATYVDLLGGVKFNEIGDGTLFLVKYDNAGKVLFVKNIGESGSNYNLFVDSDAENNIYLNSEMGASKVTVNKVTVLEPTEGDGNNVMIKLSSSGEVIWAKTNGGDNDPNTFEEYYTWTSGMAVASNGNIYIKGSLGKVAYFGDVFLNNPDHRYNKFIAKFDSDGETIWAKSISQTSGSHFCYDYNEFEIDELGNVYFGSQYQQLFTFHEGTQLVSDESKQLFVAKYTNEGNLDWVKSFESGDYSDVDVISGIAVNQNQQIVVGGRFDQSITVDNITMSSSLISHGFIVALEDPTAHSSPLAIEENPTDLRYSLYPNPVKDILRIRANDNFSFSITILSISGREVENILHTNHGGKTLELDVSHLEAGIYLLNLKSNTENWSQSFIKK